MQDLSTGEMKSIGEFLKNLPVEASPFERRQAMQSACDAVQPNRALQGPIFEVGEILEIRGGRFQVTKIEPGHLKLKSLPRN